MRSIIWTTCKTCSTSPPKRHRNWGPSSVLGDTAPHTADAAALVRSVCLRRTMRYTGKDAKAVMISRLDAALFTLDYAVPLVQHHQRQHFQAGTGTVRRILWRGTSRRVCAVGLLQPKHLRCLYYCGYKPEFGCRPSSWTCNESQRPCIAACCASRVQSTRVNVMRTGNTQVERRWQNGRGNCHHPVAKRRAGQFPPAQYNAETGRAQQDISRRQGHLSTAAGLTKPAEWPRLSFSHLRDSFPVGHSAELIDSLLPASQPAANLQLHPRHASLRPYSALAKRSSPLTKRAERRSNSARSVLNCCMMRSSSTISVALYSRVPRVKPIRSPLSRQLQRLKPASRSQRS
ncbi:transcriptional regulator [Zymobacter palmae]|uniref:Transcriptional regulator n=1 Tax=Zymobacter palmae TaxID=33074 RepID=A0A348HCV0_9GAMM|nr:transcriptional regulator [Zymobacter palmae]